MRLVKISPPSSNIDLRIANDTGFTNEYAEAVNEVIAKQQTNWLGLIDGISYQDVLAVFFKLTLQ